MAQLVLFLFLQPLTCCELLILNIIEKQIITLLTHCQWAIVENKTFYHSLKSLAYEIHMINSPYGLLNPGHIIMIKH